MNKYWITAIFFVAFCAIAALPSTSARCLLNTSCDFGGVTTTAFNFTTDGTGNAEFVIPNGSISNAEVLDGGLVASDTNFFSTGASPAATCTVGSLFVDTDQTVDTNCTTGADNSLCICSATDTWTALENN